MKTALQNYHGRMLRALDYIDSHLDGQLDLEKISAAAAFSKFHFHRQFTAAFGVSVYRYVQLARLKRASYRLAYREDERVTEIAMEAGYEAPDAFARAFRQRFGQSPSEFRTSPDWEPWHAALGPLDLARSKRMQKTYTAQDVTIRTVTATRIALMEHRGDPASLGATIQRFIAWRKARNLHPKDHPTFNVWRSERLPEDPSGYSVDLCVGTDGPIDDENAEIKAGEIPAGRCAVMHIVGNTDNLEPAALYLYRTWLPESGEETRDFPIYCQRLSFFPEVPEHEAVVDLFLPLK